tara:strand:- start:6517 stop:7425 length:909 start_codon:yes stop_codon:yes gene_type:complete
MIYLTYKSDLHDGFGAQYQRILGVYSICKKYNFNYVHTPLYDIEYQGLAALEKNENDPNFVNFCNEKYMVKSTCDAPPKYDEIITKDLSLKELLSLDHESKDILVKYKFPYIITDCDDTIYQHVQGIYKPSIPKNEIFTVGLHVRRGELNVVSCKRLLPNSYYINIANTIKNICIKHNKPFIIELYTEVATQIIKVTPTHVGINKRINRARAITPESSAIEDFDVLPQLHKYINMTMSETFDRMINCDILLSSRSSFSACAAYIKEGITIYHPFQHNMQSRNISSQDSDWKSKAEHFIIDRS